MTSPKNWILAFLLLALLPNSVTEVRAASTASSTEVLPLEIQTDLLVEELSQKRQSKDYAGVIEVISRIRSLDAQFPDFLYWIEAQALYETGQILETRDRILAYLGSTGRTGRFYKQASELLVIISPEAERIEKERDKEREERAREVSLAEEKARFLRTQNAQRLLDQLGFPVPNTGEVDKKTMEAVAVYQIRRDLTINGLITDEVIDLLQSEVPDKHVCDDLARYSQGPTDWRIVTLDSIDAVMGISECNNALREYPDVVRFQIQYARSLAAAGRGEESTVAVSALARKGYPAAEFLIGQLHERGLLHESGKPDHKNALRMFNFAAERNYATAEHKLGSLYESGVSVKRDSKTAANYYLKAANQGFVPSQMKLADLLTLGRGIQRDYVQALRWYTRAATEGHSLAQYEVGEIYERGRGVPKDKATAIKWYKQSAKNGNKEAAAKVKRLDR